MKINQRLKSILHETKYIIYIILIVNIYIFLDMKRSEHVPDSEDDVDFVQPTPPRPTPRENRKKEKQTTTSTFIDDDGFVREYIFL